MARGFPECKNDYSYNELFIYPNFSFLAKCFCCYSSLKISKLIEAITKSPRLEITNAKNIRCREQRSGRTGRGERQSETAI